MFPVDMEDLVCVYWASLSWWTLYHIGQQGISLWVLWTSNLSWEVLNLCRAYTWTDCSPFQSFSWEDSFRWHLRRPSFFVSKGTGQLDNEFCRDLLRFFQPWVSWLSSWGASNEFSGVTPLWCCEWWRLRLEMYLVVNRHWSTLQLSNGLSTSVWLSTPPFNFDIDFFVGGLIFSGFTSSLSSLSKLSSLWSFISNW